MLRTSLLSAAGIAIAASLASAQAPYSILRTAKVGGDGGFDYVYADVANRRLYIPRSGQGARVSAFDLDKLDSVGTIANTSARGAAVSAKSSHGFSSSKPVAMWDAKTLQPIKTIEVQGNPDGILYDAFNDRVWVFSHAMPHATVIDAASGDVVGTLDLGGAPEQAQSDGKGTIYVDIEDKDNVAVVDAKNLTVKAHYDISAQGKTPAGLAFDVKNHVLFVACRNPAVMVIISSDDGRVLGTVPIGAGTDGALFNPNTMEAFSSNGADSSLTVIKENSPTSFSVVQNLRTMRGAKTSTLDLKTGRILLIAAEYGPTPPPPAGGGRAGRPPMLPGSFSIIVVGKP